MVLCSATLSNLGFYRTIKGRIGRSIGAFIAAWTSIVLAAGCCALELAIAGTTPLNVTLPAMVGIHALIGIWEGLITTAVIGFVLATRPDLLELEKI